MKNFIVAVSGMDPEGFHMCAYAMNGNGISVGMRDKIRYNYVGKLTQKSKSYACDFRDLVNFVVSFPSGQYDGNDERQRWSSRKRWYPGEIEIDSFC